MNTGSLHLAETTIKAVDQIGEHAAKEIDEAADEIRKGADAVAKELEDLAATIREHTIKASGQVSQYVQMTTHTLGIVRELREKVVDKGQGVVDGSKPRISGPNGGDSSEVRRQESRPQNVTRTIP